MNNICGYTHFRSYHDSIKNLDKEDKRDILEAIDDFMFEDLDPEFVGFKSAIWSLIKPNLISSKNKSHSYQTKTKTKSNETNDLLENKDKNKDKDKNKNKEKNKDNIIFSSSSTKNIYEYFEENFNRTIAPIEAEKLDSWIEDFNYEIVKHAIDLAVLNGARTFNYIESILRNWKSNNFRSLNQILEDEKDHHLSRDKLKETFDYNWLEDFADE